MPHRPISAADFGLEGDLLYLWDIILSKFKIAWRKTEAGIEMDDTAYGALMKHLKTSLKQLLLDFGVPEPKHNQCFPKGFMKAFMTTLRNAIATRGNVLTGWHVGQCHLSSAHDYPQEVPDKELKEVTAEKFKKQFEGKLREWHQFAYRKIGKIQQTEQQTEYETPLLPPPKKQKVVASAAPNHCVHLTCPCGNIIVVNLQVTGAVAVAPSTNNNAGINHWEQQEPYQPATQQTEDMPLPTTRVEPPWQNPYHPPAQLSSLDVEAFFRTQSVCTTTTTTTGEGPQNFNGAVTTQPRQLAMIPGAVDDPAAAPSPAPALSSSSSMGTYLPLPCLTQEEYTQAGVQGPPLPPTSQSNYPQNITQMPPTLRESTPDDEDAWLETFLKT
eukprot:TRINITY_DN52036_c0_g1_i2.p1 TRINITY_DN52036_c0_g1~~TRINITY_DN52036_c0_g1_i2.p1  ORF type:complete len:385 (+),score=35.17 TRINITY_DN52036_c0_g1_i2:71-1225(+)